MPIYEYSCKKCGQTIEIIQKFSDSPLKKHAKCGGSLTKLISQSAFQLKGGGWYATDYVKKPQTQAEGGGKDGGDAKSGSESKESKESKDTKKDSKTTEAPKDSASKKTASPAPTASSSSSKSSDK